MNIKRLPKPAAMFFALLSLAVLMLLVFAHNAVACVLVKYSDFELIAPNVYVAPETSIQQRQQLLALYGDATQRVISTFGEITASPVIISGHSMERMHKYSDNEYAKALFVPTSAFIILGSKGHSVDILAHELVHAELFNRVGYWKRAVEIPTWFDEGVAMQVDYRERYDIRKYLDMREYLKTRPVKSDLQFGWQFFTNNDEQLTLHYASAKEEVRRWLKKAGPGSFYGLLEKIKQGESFEKVYGEIGNES